MENENSLFQWIGKKVFIEFKDGSYMNKRILDIEPALGMIAFEDGMDAKYVLFMGFDLIKTIRATREGK